LDTSYRITFENTSPGVLAARIFGIAHITPAEDAIRRVGQESATSGSNAVLLDIRGVLGALGTYERAALARFSLQYLSHLEKLAWLTGADKVGDEPPRDDLQPRIRIFSDEAVAVNWLLQNT